MVNKVKIRVPGTTANCGPGFDAVGMACTIYNYVGLTLSEYGPVKIEITGEGGNLLPRDNRNIVLQAVRKVLATVQCSHQGIHLVMENNIPLARGLGSSAAAIVGGLIAANVATGNLLTRDAILTMATELEGHPDNVAPAIYGGIAVSVLDSNKVQCLHFSPARPLLLVVAVPEFTLSTQKSRDVLPLRIPFGDAVFNVSRTAMLLGALCRGEFHHLKYALEDRLHQPYREALIPGMRKVFAAAMEAGALGAAISGAGPCLIAYTEDNGQAIGEAMVDTFLKYNVNSRYMLLSIDCAGAQSIS